jgi:hypothetical protein
MYQYILEYVLVTCERTRYVRDAYSGLQVPVSDVVFVHLEQPMKNMTSNDLGVFFRKSAMNSQIFPQVQVLTILHTYVEPASILVPTVCSYKRT